MQKHPSPVAVAAFQRGGAGVIKDRRLKRLRDRSANKRWAIDDAR